ncbi:MAG: phage holin family protein [Rhodocyclaceae bacterium]|nr:phage holin family protein [Rhodocyclaceae bacterium]
MIPSLVRMMIRRPEWLVDHLDAYSELAREDLRHFRARLLSRLALGLVALGSGLTAVILAGVATLMWAGGIPYHWAFVIVPLVPLAISVGTTLHLVTGRDIDEPLGRTWDQFDNDLALIREIRK